MVQKIVERNLKILTFSFSAANFVPNIGFTFLPSGVACYRDVDVGVGDVVDVVGVVKKAAFSAQMRINFLHSYSKNAHNQNEENS